MLLSLAIRNFVIVDELELEFAPGFTVLTGETGAGKSILIDALAIALGERADTDVIREGANRAEVAAEFRPHAAARAWLAANDFLDAADADGSALLRRTVDAGGRSRAYINGSAATVAQLRELGELLVDVHGQHAHQSLLKPAAQLQLLDAHGALEDQAATVAVAHAAWRHALHAYDEAQRMAGAAQAERERLRWIADELDEVAPQFGEWEAVEAEHARLAHAASLLEGAQAAVDALAEADGAALTRIDTVSARLGALLPYDARLRPILDALEGARAQVDDAARELQRYLGRADLDGSRLAAVEVRVAALHAAARKLRCQPAELPAIAAETERQLAALSASADLGVLQARAGAAYDAYMNRATALSQARAKAARVMAREVTRAMQDLSMAGGSFDLALTPSEPAASGLERAEFLVAGHAGVTPRPLARVASGGELARISLAIAVIAATATPVDTLIFDEVDAGIGGAVAETVGRLLQQLGRERQVLCVTHLPQVAARGDQHFVVGKETDAAGKPVSRIAALDRRSRVEELARMLGGMAITDISRKHAREMLAG
jgi:DNA repair protein RecN (Recombination protein N)